jgi:hypothetical protein
VLLDDVPYDKQYDDIRYDFLQSFIEQFEEHTGSQGGSLFGFTGSQSEASEEPKKYFAGKIGHKNKATLPLTPVGADHGEQIQAQVEAVLDSWNISRNGGTRLHAEDTLKIKPAGFPKHFISSQPEHIQRLLHIDRSESAAVNEHMSLYRARSRESDGRPGKRRLEGTLSEGTLQLSQLALQGSFSKSKMYTKEDLRDLVAYAERYNVEIIPEIDLPAHSLSWGKAFSDVVVRCDRTASTSGTPHNVYPLNPARNMTYAIIRGVLQQVAEVFPSPYIHIGGDEVRITMHISMHMTF